MSDSAESSINRSQGSKKFEINIPPVEVDFPDMCTKKTKIFPLPISHENQCKTVGVASNLDLFTKEFNFKSDEKSKFMPPKSSGKEFDLNKGYERCAFLKSLEQHKNSNNSMKTF